MIRRGFWWLPVTASVAVIMIATLRPSSGGPLLHFDTCLICGRDPIADAVRNVILFVPLGMALGLATRRRVWPLLAAALLSAAIECVQQWLPGRDPSLGDILTNSTGAALGLAMVSFPRLWVRTSGWLTLGAGVLVGGGVLAGGYLLQPHIHPRLHNTQWTQQVTNLEWYRGRVLGVTVGGDSLPNGQISDPDTVARLLLRGEPLRIRVLTGPPVHSLASLFSIYDAGGSEVLLVGLNAHDLVFRYAMWARHFRIDEPDMHARGLTLGPRGDTVTVSIWRRTSGYCIAVSGVSRCGLGYTVGSQWSLVWFSPGLPPAVRPPLNFFWLLLLAAPLGFWFEPGWRGTAGVAVVIVALALTPALTGLLPTPFVQWLAALVGFLVGIVARRTSQRHIFS